eukprot:CAMPEP_0198562836 /NCGR_PEP_ID=MMETSP1462-20131121/97787_1 /TAXON_ID=1333877 /ORGANISM="Brandtodinium nutriculum, Strain RCC3387" /LENGTH=47 /DNA_ID= /DNA_START= /DNA_END= /DNA_ORIENTATION=
MTDAMARPMPRSIVSISGKNLNKRAKRARRVIFKIFIILKTAKAPTS